MLTGGDEEAAPAKEVETTSEAVQKKEEKKELAKNTKTIY